MLFWSHILRDDKCGYLLVQKLFGKVEYFGRGDKIFRKKQDCKKDPLHSSSHYSQVPYVFLWEFFEDLLNYIFLERLLSKELENHCLHLPRCVYGGHIGLNKMDAIK